MLKLTRIFSGLTVLALGLSACGTATPAATETPAPTPVPPTATPMPVPTSVQSVENNNYRNLFKEYLGKTDAEIQAKQDTAWQQLFYGDDDSQRVYYPVGDDMAYITDIGNSDVRTEGMSYGMMIAVQLDKQEEFNRLWKWTKTYMYQSDGPYKGYFAWHNATDGKKLAANPASDGEEWFTTALLFASARWGNGDGIFNYEAEAQSLLHTMLHREDTKSDLATNLFNKDHHMVVFVPTIGRDSSFSDASYHLPAFYEVWAERATEDKDFWTQAAQASRDYFKQSANPQTGLMPDYGNFDGTPYGEDDHKDFRYDAWRTLSNVAVDYAWYGKDPWEAEQSNRILAFLAGQGMGVYANQYALDGKPLSSQYSTGLGAMAAVAALAANEAQGKPFVQELWDTRIPTGQWRYYDGMLYMLAWLHVSGHFRVYAPAN